MANTEDGHLSPTEWSALLGEIDHALFKDYDEEFYNWLIQHTGGPKLPQLSEIIDRKRQTMGRYCGELASQLEEQLANEPSNLWNSLATCLLAGFVSGFQYAKEGHELLQ